LLERDVGDVLEHIQLILLLVSLNQHLEETVGSLIRKRLSQNVVQLYSFLGLIDILG
jgi:hypothetical protein